MNYRIMILATLLLAGCQKKEDFVQKVFPGPDPRFEKTYKMDTTTTVSMAVDVDILWVIDNSGSMGGYQREVAKNSGTFIQQFTANSQLQWKLGLLSTDEADAPYLGFSSTVDYMTPDAVHQFNTAVGRLGTGGDPIEKSFQPVLNTLNGNPAWLRPGAFLVLIFVSDELEQSFVNTAQFMSQMQAKLGGDISRLIAYGVYSPSSNDRWNNKYNEIVQRTNGKAYSLSGDFGVQLADLGQDLVKKVTVAYPIILLDQRPLKGTIEVRYKGRVLAPATDWVYNPANNYIEIRNTAILDPKDLNIKVSFQVDRS